MRLRISQAAVLSISLFIATGCQQGTSVPNPLSVFSPPHVPPPQTGSYAVPDQYFRGQAKVERESPDMVASSEGSVIGSGVAQTGFNSRGSSVIPASHLETQAQISSGPGYRGVTPSIPQSAMRANNFPSTSSRSAGLQQSDYPPQFQTSNQQSNVQQQAARPLNWRSPGSSQY